MFIKHLFSPFDAAKALSFVCVACCLLGLLWGVVEDSYLTLTQAFAVWTLCITLCGLLLRKKLMIALWFCPLLSLFSGLLMAWTWSEIHKDDWSDLVIEDPIHVTGRIFDHKATKHGSAVTLSTIHLDRLEKGFPADQIRVYLPESDGKIPNGSSFSGWLKLKYQAPVATIRLPSQDLRTRLKPYVYGSVKDWRLVDEVTQVVEEGNGLNPLSNELLGVFLRGEPAYEWRELLAPLGVGHLLAISGLHCMLVFFAIRLCVFWIRRPTLRLLLVTAGLLAFATWMRWTPSVTRATLMLILWQLIPLINAPRSWLRGWAAVVVCLLVLDPSLWASRGFWYTFAASLGLVLGIRPKLRSPLIHPLEKYVRWGLPIVSAQLFVLPINLMFMGATDLISLIWNICGLVFLLALLATAALGCVAIWIPVLVPIANGTSNLLASACQWLANQQWQWEVVRQPGYPLFILLFLSLMAAILLFGRREMRWYLVLSVTLCFLLLGKPTTRAGVVMLDVGQGQCCLLLDDQGRGLLFDVGGRLPIGVTLTTALRLHGLKKLEAIVISHHNTDHFELIEQLADAIAVTIPECQIQSFQANPLFKDRRLIALGRDDFIEGPRDMQLELLWPDCSANAPNNNESGIVLGAQIDGVDFCFMGDAGHFVERSLAQTADVLQVGHHGSRSATSSSFLAQLRPKLALISCGANNRFGHPHADVLGRLDVIEAETMATQRFGSISVFVDRGSFQIQTIRPRLPGSSD